jgi:hypothetical protein
MHKEFGEWYRLAGIEPTGEILANRWSVVETYSPSREDVVSLTQLFYQVGKADETFLSSFVGAFQEADPAFRTRENNHELSVLAGAKLIDIITGSNLPLADMAALSLVSAAASNMRPGPSVKDIPEIAVRYLAKRSSGRASAIEADAGEASDRKSLFESLTALGAPYDELAKEFELLRRQLGVVTEESNILWWLFSEFSRDEEERWTKFSVPAAALMAGKELADLTVVLPGPVAASAFLDRVIKCVKPKPPTSVLIADAINGVSIDWRQRYSNHNCPSELELLLPIGHGVKVSLTAPGNGEWLPAFTQTTGIPEDAEVAPHVLAHQVYIESLLCRSWKGLT